MIAERIPPVPKDRFERLLHRLVRKVNALERDNTFQPDEDGAFQIGEVRIVQQVQDDGSIIVSLQNAQTLGPALTLGTLT